MWPVLDSAVQTLTGLELRVSAPAFFFLPGKNHTAPSAGCTGLSVAFVSLLQSVLFCFVTTGYFCLTPGLRSGAQ